MPDLPQTRASITGDVSRLGLSAGDTVLVHASLRSLGWVCGGAVAVVQALFDVLGPGGTLVVPTQTMGNSDPKHWSRPPVPESWWPVIRENMPAFDPALTPAIGMGAIVEMVRTWPGAVRSDHPHASFAAVGRLANELMADHDPTCQLGEHSPLAALERVAAKVLLLGVGFASCTAFHLAEYQAPDQPTFEFGTAVRAPEGRRWITWVDVATNSDDFEDLGAAYEQAGTVTQGKVGDADCRLFPVRDAVAFAVGWIAEHRSGAQGGAVTGGG